MTRFLSILFVVILSNSVFAQEVELPVDFRQHNTAIINSPFLNPTFSLEKKAKHTFDLWSRWQWQSIDADPTTLLFNYSGRIGSKTAIGAGFVQHNTGVFLQTGGMVNLAHKFIIAPDVSISLGINAFGFQQEFAQNIFIPDIGINLPQLQIENEFIFQIAPGIMLDVNDFHIGLTSENMFTFSGNQNSAPEKIYYGHIDYEYPIDFHNDSNSYLKPFLYIKSIPNAETQMGLGALLSTSKFWGQVAHNNFYGISVGAGATFFKRLSIGGIFEFGTDEALEDESPSFEIITSFNFGNIDSRSKVVGFDLEDEEVVEDELSKKELRKKQKKAEAAIQRVKDSISKVKIELEEENKRKELERIAQENTNRPKTGRYEEVSSEGDLAPGYYLIANVFGTKKYYEAFMANLKKKGLNPGSIYRDSNKYNYVYLERYNTLEEAILARDSKYNGKYLDITWIFRVKGN